MIVGENYVVLGYYVASYGNFLPTFRDNLSVPLLSAKDSNYWHSCCVVTKKSGVLICFSAKE
jgi:hypothetical protein